MFAFGMSRDRNMPRGSGLGTNGRIEDNWERVIRHKTCIIIEGL